MLKTLAIEYQGGKDAFFFITKPFSLFMYSEDILNLLSLYLRDQNLKFRMTATIIACYSLN